ncbi:MAG: helix-turn-helix domain-containing protein [Dysgonomonas sp.]
MLDKVRYDMAEAANLLSVSVKTLERRIEEGVLLGTYKDGRKRFVPRESIAAYINKIMKQNGL